MTKTTEEIIKDLLSQKDLGIVGLIYHVCETKKNFSPMMHADVGSTVIKMEDAGVISYSYAHMRYKLN